MSPAFAQREPVIVIPGKAGVPVYINGIDASWGVVEGEFGLDRPGLVAPTVIYRPLLISYPTAAPAPFFPKDNKRPGYGRLEIIPPANRLLPPPAPSYYRSWSSSPGSAPGDDLSVVPDAEHRRGVGWGGGGHRWRATITVQDQVRRVRNILSGRPRNGLPHPPPRGGRVQ